MSTSEQSELITLESGLGCTELSDAIQSDERERRYTAARLREKRPEIANAVTMLLRAGYGLQETADALHIHFKSVQVLAAEDPESVAVGKKQTARLASNVGRRALEKISEFVESCTINTTSDAQRMAMVAGIAIDKAQVLDGEPTQIHRLEAPSHTDLSGFYDSLKPAEPADPEQPVFAQDKSPAKEPMDVGSDGGYGAGSVMDPGGDLVAATRRIMEAKAGKIADATFKYVDSQQVTQSKQLINNQSEVSGAGDRGAAGEGADAGSGSDRGALEGGGGGA